MEMITIIRYGINKYAVCKIEKIFTTEGIIYPIKKVLSTKPLKNRIDGKKEIAQMILNHKCPWITELHIDMKEHNASESNFFMNSTFALNSYLVCKTNAFAR